MASKTSYKDAGVDIDAGDELVERIKPMATSTKRSGVMEGLGGFAGLFALGQHSQVKDPVLVASTDGVGTKLKLAIDLKKYDTIGQDLVAMCVNDLICCGAEPLFFLDYYATGKLDVSQAADVINTIATCLKDINCALLGGETAEMPGLYKTGDFDVAGFAVGLVDRPKIIDGSDVRLGNKVIGLASSGVHSNGYSLVRKIIEDHKLDLKQKYFGKTTLGEALLAPTIIYVNAVLNLLKQFKINAMAHITGGGIVENLPRVLPKQCKAVIEKKSIVVPELFKFLQKTAGIDDAEMWRVFNMGIGYTLVVAPQDEKNIIEQLTALGYAAAVIGTIAQKQGDEAGVELV